MAESIHGHDVMSMMIELKQTFTKESLKEAIDKKFGEEARFHTCSEENMTAVELMDFLESRGKFVDEEGGFSTEEDKICNH